MRKLYEILIKINCTKKKNNVIPKYMLLSGLGKLLVIEMVFEIQIHISYFCISNTLAKYNL